LIEQLFRQGKNFAAFPFRVYYMHQPRTATTHHSPFTIQFGITASKDLQEKVIACKSKAFTIY
jgi:hypothetical protein